MNYFGDLEQANPENFKFLEKQWLEFLEERKKRK